jgi:predicted RNase H-like HicB family nuclease
MGPPSATCRRTGETREQALEPTRDAVQGCLEAAAMEDLPLRPEDQPTVSS